MEDLTRAAKHYFEAAGGYEKNKQAADQAGESVEERYIRKAKIGIRKCNACRGILPGFYFCCIDCEVYKGEIYNGETYKDYSLCVNCFYEKTVEHKHDSFADNHSILAVSYMGASRNPNCEILKPKGKGLQQPPAVEAQLRKESGKGKGKQDSSSSKVSSSHSNPKSQARKIMEYKARMEKLARIAKAHYDAAPKIIQDSVDNFFRSMVKQRGKTTVTVEDFVKSMKEKKYYIYARPELFQMLVKDRNVGMKMEESRTLYYIIQSEKPFCSWCGCFIPDIYFCCSKCSARSYALCLECFSSKSKYYATHEHYKDYDFFFLDYSVLHTTIQPTSAASHQEESGGSQAIVIRNPREDRVVTAAKLVQAVLNAGAAILSTAGACTIM
nr:Ca2+ sensor (EF-Hand superfamily) [Ipomoea batatas]